jgi:hypothetical protein
VVPLALFLLAGALGYQAYLAAPAVPSAPPASTRHEGRAARAVLFVIDGFHPRRAFDPAVMPHLARLAGTGASGIARTGPLTTTAPAIYTMMTGRPGTLLQAIFNFHSPATRVDSLLSMAAGRGWKIALAGDPAWHRQFGWLVPPVDRHQSPEPGITADPSLDRIDTEAVDFLLAKLADPTYRLLIVHLGSADAVGHLVTPMAPRYLEQLTFLDGLLGRVAALADPATTVLLATGDHGMAARGTHGGEEEARLTPYVLTGPGVRRGVSADLPQTALTSTLSALLGLPFLPVSESPPATGLLDVPDASARALQKEYFAGKLAVAARAPVTTAPRRTASPVVAAADSGPVLDAQANARLNERLFGSTGSRTLLRLATGAIALAATLLAALLALHSTPPGLPRPSRRAHLTLSVAGPLAVATVAATFVQIRGLVAVPSTSLALGIAGASLGGIVVVAWLIARSLSLRRGVTRLGVSLLLPSLIVATAPLVNSHWFQPRPYFEALGLGLIGAFGLATVRWRGLGAAVRGAARAPAIIAVVILLPQVSSAIRTGNDLLLVALSGAVLALALRLLARGGASLTTRGLPCLLFAAAWAWRAAPRPETAALALALFGLVLAAAVVARRQPESAAALVIAASAALFLILAADTHEVVVFLLAAAAALLMATVRIDLARPGVIYAVAATAVVLRICLYFELGDQYTLSSIRTAPGFALADHGLPLATVIALLLLKYSLPWFLILAALLPSIVSAGTLVALHLVDLLVLGYVARFTAVASVIDPFRILPNGMDGILGAFCVTWAEFLTFVIAAGLLALLAARPPSPTLAR